MTSGASVPETLVDEVLGYLAAARVLATSSRSSLREESLLFALPNELRRDLKVG